MKYGVSILAFFLWYLLLPIKGLSQSQYNSSADSLAVLIKNDVSDTNKVDHLNKLGWELMYDNPDTSISLSLQALELATTIAESQEAMKNKEFQTAAKRKIAQSFNCLGVYYWFKSEYALSIEYHEKSMEIRKEIGNKIGQASSLNNLGLVYKAQGDYPGALKNYFEALRIGIEMGDKELISTDLANVGTVYHDMQDFDQALHFYFWAIKIYREVGDLIGLSMTYNYVGNVYVDIKNTKKSLQYYKAALDISQQMDNTYLIAFELNNMGEVYASDSNYSQALANYHLALEKAEEVGDRGLIATILGNIGGAYLEQKNYLNSEKYLKEGVKMAQEIGALPTVESNAKMLSALYARTGQFEWAYKYQELYTTTKDSLFNDNKSNEIGKLEARHEIEMENREKQRAEEERVRVEKEKKKRVNLLQYSSIMLVLLGIGLVILILGYRKVNTRMASAVTFFAFLLFFEFMLVLLDPYVDKWSGGEPAYQLLFNAGIAACIFPLHAFFEKKLRQRLMK